MKELQLYRQHINLWHQRVGVQIHEVFTAGFRKALSIQCYSAKNQEITNLYLLSPTQLTTSPIGCSRPTRCYNRDRIDYSTPARSVVELVKTSVLASRRFWVRIPQKKRSTNLHRLLENTGHTVLLDSRGKGRRS